MITRYPAAIFCFRSEKLMEGEKSRLMPQLAENTQYGEGITETDQQSGDQDGIRHNKGAG